MSKQQASPGTSARPRSRAAGARTDSGPARPSRRISVLVADEAGMIRDAIGALLGAMPEIALVSSANNGPDALRSIATLRPDVVITELPRPPDAGATLIAAMKRERPSTRVLVLSVHAEGRLIDAALRAGADGYLLKKDSRDELANALQVVLAGKTYVSPLVPFRVVRGAWRKVDPTVRRELQASEITHRERQVIRLIAYGHPTREIAQLLSLSPKTVEKHRTNIMRKLGLRNASAVAAYAIAHSIADG